MPADRIDLLLSRLRELEARRPLPHERAIHEASRIAICDELSRLSHALHDTGYWHTPSDKHREAS